MFPAWDLRTDSCAARDLARVDKGSVSRSLVIRVFVRLFVCFFVVDGICPLTVRFALVPVQAGDFRKGAQRTRVCLQEAWSFVRCASSSLDPPQERAVQEGECDGVGRSRCFVLFCSGLVWFGCFPHHEMAIDPPVVCSTPWTGVEGVERLIGVLGGACVS